MNFKSQNRPLEKSRCRRAIKSKEREDSVQIDTNRIEKGQRLVNVSHEVADQFWTRRRRSASGEVLCGLKSNLQTKKNKFDRPKKRQIETQIEDRKKKTN